MIVSHTFRSVEAFMAIHRVETPEHGCWNWIKGCSTNGYGLTGTRHRRHQAHRLAYEIATGTTPGKMCVCHRCDNPKCVRPDHLFLGTQLENIVDRHTKGRSRHMRQRISGQRWHLSHRYDPRALPLADRHYNRRKPGSPQFAPPGSCLVLLTEDASAVWITSWPKGEYVRHAWPGAWVNSLFRNEGPHLSSELIIEAVAATCAFYGAPPKQGMVTFVDPEKTRRKRDPGRCYRKAGFTVVGETAKDALVALQLPPGDMPMGLGAMPMIKVAS